MSEQHTVPCLDCPFRRKSLPGYLGHNRLVEFSVMAVSDARMPCHSLVDYDEKDWVTKQQTVPQCAGRAIMLGNMAKMPRDRSILRLAANRDLIFNNVGEFRNHHETTSTRIVDAYEDGVCPECELAIPCDVKDADDCKGCGYTFFEDGPLQDGVDMFDHTI